MGRRKKKVSHNDPKPQNQETHPADGSNRVDSTVAPTQVQVLLAFIEEYKSRDRESTRLQTWTFWLGVVTAGLVFAYTTVAALQWAQMTKATCAAQQAARAAQQSATTSTDTLHSSYRPWVAVDQRPIVVGSIHQSPSKVNLKYELKNTGTSVALGVSDALWISGDMSLFNSDHCKQMADTEKQAIYLAQKTGGKAGGVTPETGTVIFPNGTQTSQVAPQEGAPLGPTENVYALVCIAYFDQFQVAHFTKLVYCFTSWPAPQWKDLPQFCKQGNYAD